MKKLLMIFYVKFGYNYLNAVYLIYKIVDLNGRKNLFSIIKRSILSNYINRKYHIIIGKKCKIGKNLILPHPQNIIIGRYVVIGDNCKIYQNVTIGMKKINGEGTFEDFPKIEDNCTICSSANVLGGIVVSENTTIAANSSLIQNTIPNSLYAGVPAKLKKRFD